ncbi:tRNA pseudouridine(55) synthase TruB [Bifidobacterium pullorum subsp. saeculare]|uniref:tRNA pseudouridine synthase B n=1 Tax=Bifidobacterium pullorum subsp. saeculare TaxID=78257 RepID=A0A938X010_9BIFI|nr:tRNA pseudouridine(55) synthase TruB [Bifidobacterium pullorum]MBM6699762.1 tRNA pseudouridine(55) synthase TruB [Bifidobacterium pullorum subsp. saeculare]
MDSGLLLVDKPRGVTSFDAVAAVRGALRTKKVGHAGTLDPMATGLLVIGFGHATRLLTAIVEHDKIYEATVRLGLATTTDDAEGAILPADVADRVGALDRAAVEAMIADRFLGRIEQVPNTFSAIKIGGRRAYDLARDGKDVELKARPVTIAAFDVLDVRRGLSSAAIPGLPLGERGGDGDETAAMVPVLDVDVRVSCSSGTYIRALARDLGAALGVGGHLVRLRRTRVGRFALADDRSGLVGTAAHAIGAHRATTTFTNREGQTVTRASCVLDTPEGLAGAERADWLRARALTMGEAVRGAMPVVAIDAGEAAELRFGRRLERGWPSGADGAVAAAVIPGATPADDDVVALVAPARGGRQLKPVTVFNAR